MQFIFALFRTQSIVQFVLLGLLGSAGFTVSAQEPAGDAVRVFTYSAKFVCKSIESPATGDAIDAVGQGVYRTVINLQNTAGDAARLSVRAAEAHSIATTGGGAAGEVEKVLRPGEAIFIACPAIQRILGSHDDPPSRLDGFVNIVSTRRLNAAAVYTAVTRTPRGPNDGISVDVENLRARVRRIDTGEEVQE
jgi:hypothetical protein